MDYKEYLEQVSVISNQLNEQKTQMEKILKILSDAKNEAKQIFICGNGGSAGTATHMACDLFKMSGLRAISLDENTPLLTALINDDGWDNLYTSQLERLYIPGDILIAISVHGGVGEDKAGKWSQNINKAIEYVNGNCGKTIGFSGFDGGAMKKDCTVCIVIPANSTPLVESFHGVLHHFVAFALQTGNRA